jgi:hypothetical protein
MEEPAMRRIAAVLLAGLTCLLQGCVLGVGWLPNSSGFVYTTPQGRLMAYDIAAKKCRLVLEDPAAKTTAWPGMSPTGKRIALAHVKDDDDQKNALMQIVLCDLKGKIEFRSDHLKVAKLRGKDHEYAAQLAWSPDEKNLIVHGQGRANQGRGFNTTVLYDIAAKKMQLWDDHVPAYFGGTPIRPDGKGFLLAKVESIDDVDGYLWVDWSGAAKKIPVGIRKGGKNELITPWSALADSRWDSAKAILVLARQQYVIDTENLKFTAARAADTMIGKEGIVARAKLASGIEILMLGHEDDSKQGPPLRVVSRKPGAADLPQVIPPVRDRTVSLSLAPNAKHATIRVAYDLRGSKSDTIYVVDETGRVSDIIEVVAPKE